MFWAVEVKPGKGHSIELEAGLSLRLAVLDKNAKDNERNILSVKYNDKSFVLCSLRLTTCEQVNLGDIFFPPGSQLTFSVSGTSSVHLLGAEISFDLDDEFGDGDSDDLSGELSDDDGQDGSGSEGMEKSAEDGSSDVPAALPAGKRKPELALPAPKKAKDAAGKPAAAPTPAPKQPSAGGAPKPATPKGGQQPPAPKQATPKQGGAPAAGTPKQAPPAAAKPAGTPKAPQQGGTPKGGAPKPAQAGTPKQAPKPAGAPAPKQGGNPAAAGGLSKAEKKKAKKLAKLQSKVGGGAPDAPAGGDDSGSDDE